ncbi:hypothetical protein GGH16_004755, partial [Coemansia sp. RSA 560]
MGGQPLPSSYETNDDSTAALLTFNNGRLGAADIEADVTAKSPALQLWRKRVVHLCAATLLVAAFVGGLIMVASTHSGKLLLEMRSDARAPRRV